VYDDAVSVFVKARDDLLLSILDGNDVEESAEEYIFAKSNLALQNYEYDVTWRENICNSFVLRKEKKQVWISREERDKQIAEQNIGHLSDMHPWKGRVKGRGALSDEERLDSEGVEISNEKKKELIADKIATSHAHDVEVNDDTGLPFGHPDDHPFSSSYDPSKAIDVRNGLPKRVNRIIEQVLPLHGKHVTHAKKSETIEKMQDDYMREEKSPHHAGINTSNGVVYNGLSPLGGLKGSDITSMRRAYDRDFDRWLSGDDDWRSIHSETGELDHDGSWRNNAIAEVKSKGLSTDIASGHDHSEEELALRAVHVDDRARSWMSDAVDRETKQSLSEASDVDPYAAWMEAGENVGVGEALTPKILEHGHKLGEAAFLHQLQWFSPKERSAIMRAVHSGLDKPENQDIRLPDGSTVSAGRIKRSTHHALSGLANYGGRREGFTNPNAFPHPRETNEQLSKEDQDELYDSLHDVIHENGLSDDIVEAMREALGLTVPEKLQDGSDNSESIHFDELGKIHSEIRNLPNISPEQLGDDPPTILSPQAAIHQSLTTKIKDIIHSGHTEDRLSKSAIMLALGFDPESGAAIAPGEHPFYANHSGPLVSEQDMAVHLDEAKKRSGVAMSAKEMRNQMLLHTSPLFFKENELSDKELVMMQGMGLGDGGHYGLAAFLSSVYAGGGLNRNPHTIMEMLHDHLSYEDPETGMSTSILGTKDGNRFTVNPDNIGLFAPYFNHRYNLFNTPQAILSNYNNSKDPGTQKAANPKNQVLAGLSSLAPGLVNRLSGMSMKEIKAAFGKEFDMLKPTISSRQHSVITPHGKGIDYKLAKPTDIAEAGEAAEYGNVVNVAQEHMVDENRDNTKDDRVSLDQAIMSHAIGTIMGWGHRDRAPNTVNLTPEGLSQSPASFGARVGDFTDYGSMLEFLGAQGGLNPENLKGEGRQRGAFQLENMGSRIQSHYSAITQMAGALAQLKPEGTFDPSNPNLSVEIDKIFKEANQALMFLPRGATFELPDGSTFTNNLTVSEYGFDKEMVSPDATGFTGLPDHLQEHGLPVNKETTLEELMTHLNYPNDGKHRVHAQEVLNSIQSGLKGDDDHRLVMSMDQLMRSNPGISTIDGTDGPDKLHLFDKYQNVENMDSHVKEVFGSNWAKNPDNTKLSDEEFLERFGHGMKTVKNALGEEEEVPVTARDVMAEMHHHVRSFEHHLKNHSATPAMALLGLSTIRAPEERRKEGKRNMLHSLMLDGETNIDVSKFKTDVKFTPRSRYIQHRMKDIIMHNPDGYDSSKLPDDIEQESIQFGPGREIHPTGPDGYSIMDLFGSSMAMKLGNHRRGKAESGLDFSTGKPVLGEHTVKEPLLPVPMSTINSVWNNEVAAAVAAQDASRLTEVDVPNMFMFHPDQTTPAEDFTQLTWSEPSDYAAFLLNPDSLLMKEDSPSWVPPIRPMHRIFTLKDLRRLRGFTGSWVVSKWYDGERIVLTKEGDKVKAFDENGKRRSIPGWAKNGIKKLGEKDCTLDGVLEDDELHIIDITYYDDTDVTDMSVQERLKMLRGQYDSYEKVTIPGPHDTRLVDEEGLEDMVNTFLDEHKTLLLRDGKSTYMKGERRHPKWVLLRPTKTINLKVLDRRGKKPFTYRLGAGPVIDDEGIEDRTVEHDGEIYLDVGTVSSPKPFEEGDIVNVKVSGVKHQEIDGRDVYSLTPIRLVGEGEGESSVSMETLGMLSKSYPHLHFPHDMRVRDDEVVISVPYQSEVYYTLEKGSNGCWVHSPRTVLSDMGEDNYSIALSDSLKPFWGQVVSMLLKGKIERVEDPIPSEEAQEDIEEDSDELDDEDLVTKPNMGKALSVIERVLDMLEKYEGGNQFGFQGGAKGLGIDVGSLTESPRGPTHLEGEESMPDYDMRARPTEDSEKPYPHLKRQRKKRKAAQYTDSDDREEAKVK